MTRIVLLNIALLAAIGISASFPYPSDNKMAMASDNGITSQLVDEVSEDGIMSQSEDKHVLGSDLEDVSLDPPEGERAMATYEDGNTANLGELTADITLAG